MMMYEYQIKNKNNNAATMHIHAFCACITTIHVYNYYGLNRNLQMTSNTISVLYYIRTKGRLNAT